MIEVWVDPVHGNDGTGSPDPACGGGGIGHEVVRINNPGAPTKTIQVAIDIAAKYLRCHYDPLENPDQEAIVHLLPGIYSPATTFNGGVGNGEQFPIQMHDRVHLRGVNARRCVIRGLHEDDGEYLSNVTRVLWPEDTACVGYPFKQVLIDCSTSSLVAWFPGFPIPQVLPWADDSAHNRTPEIIEAVTFQGGDVQVYCGTNRELPLPVYARISNCLFDMRDGITVEQGVPLSGPSIGLLVAQTWVDEIDPLGGLIVEDQGYLPQEVHSIGNTFLMAEFDQTQGSGVWLRCRAGAVGLIDTCDPVPGDCEIGFPGDPNQVVRGVNRIGVQNTLFRTHKGLPQSPGIEMAMVGVAADDALVHNGVQYRDTNAYALARAGSASVAPDDTHQSFKSQPYATGVTPSGTVSYPFNPATVGISSRPPSRPRRRRIRRARSGTAT